MRTWKVGQLASATGLSVRTLHHYDAIGLLTPSARNPSGHRLYDEADVRRLHAVLTLRDLRVPLDGIAAALDGGGRADPEPAVPLSVLFAEHLAAIDRQVSALREVRAHLALLVRRVPTVGELLDLMREVTAANHVLDGYLTPERLAAVADRGEDGGQWPGLVAEVRAEMDRGTPPDHPRVQLLARRWMRLLDRLHGGDEQVRAALLRTRERPAAEGAGGADEAMVDYIGRANRAR